MGIGNKGQENVYYRPKADGSIVKKITEAEFNNRSADPTDNVRCRVYTDSDEVEQKVYEEFYSSVTGLIIGIDFQTHDEYGTSIHVLLRTEDGSEGTLAVNTSGGYGTSLLETLPNVDLEKDVTISAWAKEKRKVMFISQGEGKGENVVSAFRKWDDKKKAWKILKKEYPQVNEEEKEKYGKKYWPRYFGELEVYLTDFVGKEVAPKVNIAEVENVEVVEDDPAKDVAF